MDPVVRSVVMFTLQLADQVSKGRLAIVQYKHRVSGLEFADIAVRIKNQIDSPETDLWR